MKKTEPSIKTNTSTNATNGELAASRVKRQFGGGGWFWSNNEEGGNSGELQSGNVLPSPPPDDEDYADGSGDGVKGVSVGVTHGGGRGDSAGTIFGEGSGDGPLSPFEPTDSAELTGTGTGAGGGSGSSTSKPGNFQDNPNFLLSKL